MDLTAFEHHLNSPEGCGHLPVNAFTVEAGGGSCCDRIRFSVATDGQRVTDAGFLAQGCGAAAAAGSATVALVRGSSILAAAKIGPRQVAQELGGLSPGKLHAAELAADALARALGLAVRASGRLVPSQAPGTLVAMSGGVDSAVAALLSARDGETAAVTVELWADAENDAERSCCSSSAVAQARALAHRLNMPHFTLDLRDEFRQGVVEPFLEAHRAGETPNPCVGCNGSVRLDAMLEFAERLGYRWLATGHYARVSETSDPRGPLLRAAADPAKDQTYMLAALAPDTLSRLRFPLGDLRKTEVRQIAAGAGLPVAAKPDSQDLCFLAGTTRERFLARHAQLSDDPGELVDSAGTVLGTHRGQHRFTVGQRRGLGVAGGQPLFVLAKDARTRRVTVGPRHELATTRVALRGVRLRREPERVNHVKLRYRQRAIPARLETDGTLTLSDPCDGAAPGQMACLMDGSDVVGWATIAPSRPTGS